MPTLAWACLVAASGGTDDYSAVDFASRTTCSETRRCCAATRGFWSLRSACLRIRYIGRRASNCGPGRMALDRRQSRLVKDRSCHPAKGIVPASPLVASQHGHFPTDLCADSKVGWRKSVRATLRLTADTLRRCLPSLARLAALSRSSGRDDRFRPPSDRPDRPSTSPGRLALDSGRCRLPWTRP
jgi:hypothetical protein